MQGRSWPGSYIQETTKRPVSNVNNLPSSGPDSGPAHQETTNDTILAYLKNIDDTTKALGQRVQVIEENRSLNVTPIRQRSHSHKGDQPNAFLFQSASTGCQNHHLIRLQYLFPHLQWISSQMRELPYPNNQLHKGM